MDYFDRVAEAIAEGTLAPDDFLPNVASSLALENQRTFKSGNSLLYGFTALNTNAAARFIQLFDTVGPLSNGAVPVEVFTAGIGLHARATWYPGRRFDHGIVIASSSTAGTLTLSAADAFFSAQFV